MFSFCLGLIVHLASRKPPRLTDKRRPIFVGIHPRQSGRAVMDCASQQPCTSAAKAPPSASGKPGELLDAPPGRCEFDDVKRLGGVTLGAFHGNDRGKGIFCHDMLAATDEMRARAAFSALHQRTSDCFHYNIITADLAEVQKTGAQCFSRDQAARIPKPMQTFSPSKE